MNNISKNAITLYPGSFEMENHFYTRVHNAQLHPMISYFLNLSTDRIINRYCHLHPLVDKNALKDILSYHPQYFCWAGSDLFHVTTARGTRHMILIETNSCPSGQKSMPLYDEHQEYGGYRTLIEKTFKLMLGKKRLPSGGLAVIYDKNHMENSGYASTIAEVMKEPVYLTPFYDNDENPPVKFENGIMYIRDEKENWIAIRAAFRYVTQRPWNRIPVETKTLFVNPSLVCLSGGRNKMIASKAYEFYNAELAGSNLEISTPETICDVNLREIPLWIDRFGGHAVVKNPYSNAGQGVYTITNKEELETFMNLEHKYDQFIVQSLIGNYNWSSAGLKGKFYHVGTMPNKQQKIYALDIRVMIGKTEEGFRPIAIYSRKAKSPLLENLEAKPSWDMLGTNLSSKLPDGSWTTDTNRLLLMDRKDFNKLGIGIDNLIDGFIQTVLSTIAIDKMAIKLMNKKGRFRQKLFCSLNNDQSLFDEILIRDKQREIQLRKKAPSEK